MPPPGHLPERYAIRSLLLALLLLAASGCASVATGLRLPPPAVEWTRESFRPARERCWRGECRTWLTAPSGSVEITTRVRRYAPHEIPGLDGRSRAERAVGAVAGGVFRHGLGGRTERVVIGYATRVASGAGSGDWQLRCRMLWIDEQEIEYNRRDGDRVARSERRAFGTQCEAAGAEDTTIVRWRFAAGAAPPRDSLAAVFDLLRAEPLSPLTLLTPLSLERISPTGQVEERYAVRRVTSHAGFAERHGLRIRLQVEREDETPLAVLHLDMQATLDHAPYATAEEIQILRLIAASLGDLSTVPDS